MLPTRMPPLRGLKRILALALGVATAITYWPALTHEFLNIDDDVYVTENRHVKDGLTGAGLRWAFASTEEANYWHPLTWISHMLDVEVHGLNPGGHHMTNVLLHALNALLLFYVLCALCVVRSGGGETCSVFSVQGSGPKGGGRDAVWPAFFVAGLFALHPLHVECVAWISERKELLCTFFTILTIGAYARYARAADSVQGSGFRVQDTDAKTQGPSQEQNIGEVGRWYLVTLGLFVCGLMSKPMIVTLPCVLLLLDWWPLKRGMRAEGGDLKWDGRKWGRLVVEKVPFFALTILASVSAFRSQGEGDMLTPLDTLGVGWRLANAMTAYAGYLVKSVWPANLTIYYPHPMEGLPVWEAVGAGVLLLAITALAIWQHGRRPYVLVGWLGYLGTLVPVIGLVQIGSFAMADRYTYLPLVGVFVAAVWGVGGVIGHWSLGGGKGSAFAKATADKSGFRFQGQVWFAVGGAVLLVCALATRHQLGFWKNNETLFRHQLRVTGGDMVGHNGLGIEAMRRGRVEAAHGHFSEAVRHQPGLASAHVQLGLALSGMGRQAEALESFERALDLQPKAVEAQMNMGITLSLMGEGSRAVEHLRTATTLEPDNADAWSNLAVALYRLGVRDASLEAMHEAVRLDPKNSAARNNLGRMLHLSGRTGEALVELREAVRLAPEYREARENLEQVLRAAPAP